MIARVVARRSPLAVAQAEWVAARLREVGVTCELVGVETLGDVDRRRLTEIGGTGVFATAVREQILAGGADLAVHSLKDLPVAPAPGLVVAAIPTREDARDVLVGTTVDGLADGMVVGTGSPRRAVQLHDLAAHRGVSIEIVPIRGNVDTRLSLVADGVVDATLLAAAGLRRLGRLDGDDRLAGPGVGLRSEVLPYDAMLPAAGQGALAVECAAGAPAWLRAALSALDDEATRAAVTAERTFLARLEAGCLAPVGAHAQVVDHDLTLRAVTGRTEPNAEVPSSVVRAELAGSPRSAEAVGATLAEQVLAQLAVAP